MSTRHSIHPRGERNDMPRFKRLMVQAAPGHEASDWADLTGPQRDRFLRALAREEIPVNFVGDGSSRNVIFRPRTGRGRHTLFMACQGGRDIGSDKRLSEIDSVTPVFDGKPHGI